MRSRLAFIALLVLIALFALQAAAQQVRVIDGDTLQLDGTTYRIQGIDAPEMKQWCGDYPAGVLAAQAMQMLIRMGKDVTCEPRETDRYGRTVGLCRVDGRDIGKEMVRLGMAWAFTRYSQDYRPEEARARAENLGVHLHGCAPAWEWRAGQRR